MSVFRIPLSTEETRRLVGEDINRINEGGVVVIGSLELSRYVRTERNERRRTYRPCYLLEGRPEEMDRFLTGRGVRLDGQLPLAYA